VLANAIGNADMAEVMIAANKNIPFIPLLISQSSLTYIAYSLYFFTRTCTGLVPQSIIFV
jgi:hypothetical protein